MFIGFCDQPTRNAAVGWTYPLPAISRGHRKLRERRKVRRAMRKASRRK